MKSGIYKITNLINGKIYIGSTCNFKDRKSKHKRTKSNTMISRAIFKYGWDNFTFDAIEFCDKDILIEREQFYLDTLEPFKENNGYNILRNCTSNGWRGHHHTEESKKIMSEKKKDSIPWNKGKTGVQECSDETRDLMSKNRMGEGNSFYNKKHTQESKDKISEKAKERDMSFFNKRVIQMDKITKEVIKIWDSISDASEFVIGDRKSSRITAACRGRYKTAGGFCWEYE
jgi:group I intron endonuclease